MDFSLSPEQRSWRLKARRFAEEELLPDLLRRDRMPDPRQTFDWDMIRKGSRSGFRTLAVPKEWGGHGADLVTQALVMTELARGDSGFSKTISQCWRWSQLMATVCTEDQKEQFFKPFLADETYLLAMGGTEPNAGSDNRMPPESDPRAGWRLRAERKGDEWILNGTKIYIGNGSVAKLFFVPARTNPDVDIRKGTTLFMVPLDTPGFRVGSVSNKAGMRFYQNAELIFENARVPHANIVGGVNEGMTARSADPSQFGEIALAANALGICEAALDMAMAQARTGTQGGQSMKDQQSVLLKLSEMHVFTEALRSFVLRTAWDRDQVLRGTQYAPEAVNAALAAIFAKEAMCKATLLSMDIHGAAGARMKAGVDVLYRDAITTHVAGDIVHRLNVVKRLLK